MFIQETHMKTTPYPNIIKKTHEYVDSELII